MTNEELVRLYQNGNDEVLEKLIKKNMGIVWKVANKFYIGGTNSIDIEDLEQEGKIGLMLAAQKYDFDNPKKANFITYSIYWIYQRMQRFMAQKNTNDEKSLNQPVNAEEDLYLIDTVPDENDPYENIEEKIYIKQLRVELEEVMLEHTSLKERQVLKLHYGWDRNKIMTLAEIGEVFSVTGERIRNIESRALRKLRRSPWGREKIREYYSEKLEEERYSFDSSVKLIDFERKYVKSLESESNLIDKYFI